MNEINRGRINTAETTLAKTLIVFICSDCDGNMVFLGHQVPSSLSCIGSNGYGAEFNQAIRDCLEMMD